MLLTGWKDIAKYFGSGVRTVQRWERTGLPVHRPVPGKRSHVVAYSEEMDWWVRDHQPHQSPPNHLVVTIEQAKQLCEDARTKRDEIRLRMQALRQTMAVLRTQRWGRIKFDKLESHARTSNRSSQH